MREIRWALLDEGGHAFLSRRAAKPKQNTPLGADAFGQRHFTGTIDNLLGHLGDGRRYSLKPLGLPAPGRTDAS